MSFLKKHIIISFKRWKKIVVIIGFILLIWYIFCLPRPLFNKPYSTLGRIGTENCWVHESLMMGSGVSQCPIASPREYEICLMQFEDRSFKWHPGVNLLALARATKQNVRAKRIISGGSTITMQTVAKMRRNDRTYLKNRRNDSCHASNFLIQKNILKMYASHAPMGGNVVEMTLLEVFRTRHIHTFVGRSRHISRHCPIRPR